jgi:DNA-binding CsgD family transcriptional regulator
MKKFISGIFPVLLIVLLLSGCESASEKAASLSVIYGAAAALSLLLLIGAIFAVRKKRDWFILLFSSVLVVNIGYTFLSVSSCLEAALWANRVSYLGSVFLPLSMLMSILEVTKTKRPNWLSGALFGLSVLVFFIAASPGVLDIYYKDVSFQIVDGVSTLVKVYGPLHPLYLIYLLGYFAAMVTVIIRAQIKKAIDTPAHAVILAVAVLVNIGVWFIEQITVIQFEMLSVSYIISESFLLGVHLVMNENQRLRNIVKQVESTQHYMETPKTELESILETPLDAEAIAPERLECFMNGLKQLTPTEREVFDAYIARATTKEVMAKLNIKESTLKYHNRNIYGKLGVSSRKELLELCKRVKDVKSTLEAVGNVSDKEAQSNN